MSSIKRRALRCLVGFVMIIALVWQAWPLVESARIHHGINTAMERVSKSRREEQIVVSELPGSCVVAASRYLHMDGVEDYSELKSLHSTWVYEVSCALLANAEDVTVITLRDAHGVVQYLLHLRVVLGSEISCSHDGKVIIVRPD